MPFVYVLGESEVREVPCLGLNSAADKYCRKMCQHRASCLKVKGAAVIVEQVQPPAFLNKNDLINYNAQLEAV